MLLIISIGTIPFAIVEVTRFPKTTAPRNSNTAAIIMTCFIVRAPVPTEVPIAFARSFAPMFQAMYKPASIIAMTSKSIFFLTPEILTPKML